MRWPVLGKLMLIIADPRFARSVPNFAFCDLSFAFCDLTIDVAAFIVFTDFGAFIVFTDFVAFGAIVTLVAFIETGAYALLRKLLSMSHNGFGNGFGRTKCT